jgi:hypothetical protein
LCGRALSNASLFRGLFERFRGLFERAQLLLDIAMIAAAGHPMVSTAVWRMSGAPDPERSLPAVRAA